MYNNNIEYYLIYIGEHPQVISKKNNNSLDKYYICYGFRNLNSFPWIRYTPWLLPEKYIPCSHLGHLP